MSDLIARLSSHNDPRLYREADELMQEAAEELARLRVELAGARAAAMEEAAVIADDWGDAREPARGGDALKNCAADIREAITEGAKP